MLNLVIFLWSLLVIYINSQDIVVTHVIRTETLYVLQPSRGSGSVLRDNSDQNVYNADNRNISNTEQSIISSTDHTIQREHNANHHRSNTTENNNKTMASKKTETTQDKAKDTVLVKNPFKVPHEASTKKPTTASDGIDEKKKAKIPSHPNNITDVDNISFEDRSVFNGDPCPTGYTRVNDKCVKIDT
ncbi:unnamed protein product [Colias eurytheme]|nr:unnamed protein product [Colias eurytheme]